MLQQLNFHHLFYFWTVANEGSVKGAARALRLAHPTISGQIKQLEEQLGHKLFRRVRRGLELTDEGRLAYQYAETIIATGQELVATMAQASPLRPSKIVIGVTEVMPKLVVRELVAPAWDSATEVRVIMEEDRLERLLADLARHAIDVVLSDLPVPDTIDVKAYNHPLGECGLSFLASEAVVKGLDSKFPENLDGAPFLVPGHGSAMRRSLDRYFRESGIAPRIVAEVADSALIKVFGSDSRGVFCVPSIIEKSVCEEFHVVPIGSTEEHRERFFAISTERRVTHPGVLAICSAARSSLFA